MKMQRLPRWLPALLTLVLMPLRAGAMDLAATRAAIDAHIHQPRFAAARWGIAVVSLDSGRTLYAHDADKLFQPASTAKLFTAALVLSGLDTAYRIPTRVLGPAPDRRGRVDGPLVLYGMGDPSLGTAPSTANWADALAAQLEAHGVRRVRGDLVADATYFAGAPIGSGWEAADLLSGFAAPASALSVDDNQLRLTVAPAAHDGRLAQLAFDRPSAAMLLENRLITSPAGTAADINLYRTPGSDLLHAFGSIASRSSPRSFRLAIPDPARAAGNALLQALQQRGIEVDGQLRVLRWPQLDTALRTGAGVLAEVRSPPVAMILREGLKRSQNLYLQNLLQLAGTRAAITAAADPAATAGFLGAADWGIRALHQLLDRIGIPPSASLIGEGTGLSRRDLTTPAALVRLLSFLAAGSDAAEVRDMLPVAAVDGTLAPRMRGTPAAGNVHAKTGSMTYVTCLAGYVTSAAGEHLAFAVLLNDYAPPAGMPASADVDAIAVWLAELSERSL
ncbi:D-alanyl-D-alanine carboxypeptidase/D-alanyl-D-alanine endopeptidase [Frateuria terrea]|uniref:D-alanyl-D-alanine carboxypeptidase / D-alanyl-D-alanine-endopeptidase (Penicillin-binding protein 4) n=1 Tax=Frateuria terrea TaxID=529704 RepID=A0A1H6R6J9_9GAMM|nr:D-alanyl-D-alanine carboxypeptidase/D-alanyl-D-alanine-endopeptidase [Frateuria terrea]SEI47410.1 D-alanyl-D-alanine carboxypeptidase / D-alanyl-D-alanine-endopeptidase (penicillin-binding protein 4) [Frateuria terrea]SFP13269.1 D-alanyl-D-alanine carboxypeptidase / D-alanyl-D-alanine-endopeptidase (penicillin-binding protein 4) [Frateuria terrea]